MKIEAVLLKRPVSYRSSLPLGPPWQWGGEEHEGLMSDCLNCICALPHEPCNFDRRFYLFEPQSPQMSDQGITFPRPDVVWDFSQLPRAKHRCWPSVACSWLTGGITTCREAGCCVKILPFSKIVKSKILHVKQEKLGFSRLHAFIKLFPLLSYSVFSPLFGKGKCVYNQYLFPTNGA